MEEYTCKYGQELDYRTQGFDSVEAMLLSQDIQSVVDVQLASNGIFLYPKSALSSTNNLGKDYFYL